jgi:hypothetical protein
MIENERKSNTQFNKILEQKENNSDSCKICQDLNKLLQIEKQNNIQLIKQIQNQKKLKEQQRNEKQVSLLHFKIISTFYFLYLDS